MKAIGYKAPGAIEREDALQDIELPRPVPAGRDILVQVKAISVNPVDTKVRKGASPEAGQWKVLGWDAVGTVVETGPTAKDFKIGDEVFYAGSLTRPGANSQFHLVDERIVGSKPKSVSDAQAAALPLTAITAWEMLFDRLDIRKAVPGAANAIVIIGGAGGVGSIAIQLVRALTDVTVIATASRPETQDWVKTLGAHHVIDHSKPIAEQVAALGIGAPAFVFSTTESHRHLKEIIELIAPQGRFGLIDDPESLDVLGFKRKAVSIHWELMFTRSIFETADMAEQGRLLNEVSRLIDEGKIRTTATEILSPINAANLRKAHAAIESGRTKGKVVLEGFSD
ncbi:MULTISPECIES: zinc-binding alcohol dehydrogenase family protein [Agrobacterium]|uniref:Zinc-type alcohol dehydrogenase-like protein n=1 Tax=Agrobacterium genomosp. 2 str. CFBP 5494 TaxID=1183436 RepID=A0A9W5B7F8_9HYPH|nr:MULTISPECIES: zinc-binding alcohol dehydrogenase family protein [Agrobacterium]RSC21393.1 zinc-binding alcohol dehydrogenase family protein [Agrobacterium sp. FDAARGOS_525]CUX03257.1 putative oxidoreductase; putative Quinone oxidoreductase [Agrobacterium genomosp. 2 str. CFBP 5494]